MEVIQAAVAVVVAPVVKVAVMEATQEVAVTEEGRLGAAARVVAAVVTAPLRSRRW